MSENKVDKDVGVLGICVAVGVAIGVAMDNVALGILVGLAIGGGIAARRKGKPPNP